MQIVSSQKTLNAILESGFVQNVIFKGAPFSTNFDSKKLTHKVVVYLELYEINLELIQTMKKAGKKVVLYHMGDELAKKNITAYSNCDLIIRNYFFPEIINHPELSHKILWAPNGYRTGVGPRALDVLKKINGRQYLACFLGWLSNTASFNGERNLFSEAVSVWSGNKKHRIKNVRHWLKHYFSLSKEYLSFVKPALACGTDMHLLSSNGFSTGYNVGLYSATMEDSIFAPCPAGNSAETIRLYDALECGCIPITLKHEFIYSHQALSELGLPPFHFLESWDQFPEFLGHMKEKLQTHPEEIQKIQNACKAWWLEYKKHIAEKIAGRIESLQ